MSLRTALAAMILPALTLAIVVILTDSRTADTVPAAALHPVPPTVTIERMVPVVLPPTSTTVAPTTTASATRKVRQTTAQKRAVQAPTTPSKTHERMIKTENGDYVPESFYRDFDPNYRPPTSSKPLPPTSSKPLPTGTTTALPTDMPTG
jgi:hypothetical protein